MTEVKFYHNAPDRLAAAAVILTKARRQGRKAVVFAPDEAEARRFDALLWTTPALSFLPHVGQHSKLASRTPIVFARQLADLPHEDLLLNLGGDLPGDFSRFAMLVEVVGRSDAERQPARRRWQFYKEQGYPVTAHDLSNLGE
ncbi:MAG: DNA polymerase III subunit chi [Moraxellaceae bacterium]|nr:DNA polymerase III subunit chi [Moraxellaceae bacterium]